MDYYSGNQCPFIVEISESAAKKFGCSISDCTCGEGLPEVIFADKYEIDSGCVEVRGNYPQN